MRKVLNRLYKTIMPLLVVLCVVLIVLRLFGLSVILVKGKSMEPTYKSGELHLITNPNKIRRGDIVTAKLETGDGTKIVIKRVIGLPGEEICIGFSTIWANGDWVQEPYLEWPGWNDFGDYDASFDLGPNEFYIMGDNRAESWCGTIKGEQIIGRVIQ